MEEKMRLEGVLRLLPFAPGSKSEGIRPFLVGDDGSRVLLYKKQDNPFENRGFHGVENQRVQVEGELRGGTFHVEQLHIQEAAVQNECSQEPAPPEGAGAAEKEGDDEFL